VLLAAVVISPSVVTYAVNVSLILGLTMSSVFPDLLEARIAAAPNPFVLPTVTLKRLGLVLALERFPEAFGLSYATTPMDKSLLSEDYPSFLGTSNGNRCRACSAGVSVCLYNPMRCLPSVKLGGYRWTRSESRGWT